MAEHPNADKKVNVRVARTGGTNYRDTAVFWQSKIGKALGVARQKCRP